MKPGIVIDHVGFTQALEELARKYKKDVGDLLRDQMKLLVKSLIKFTPPEKMADGRGAINQDAVKMAEFAYPEHYDLMELKRDAEKSPSGKAYRVWDGKVVDIGLNRIDIDGTKMMADHERFRNRRGRVVGGSNIVTSRKIGRMFRKKLYPHVGNLKRGWDKAASALGITLPAWILNSSSGPSGSPSGGIINQLQDEDPSVEVFNTTRYIRDEGMLMRALDVRAADIRKWLEVRLQKRAKEASAA